MKLLRYALATFVLCTSWLANGHARPTQLRPKETGAETTAGRLVHDVSTGRSYREEIVDVTVPTTSWEVKPVTQTVYEPQAVTSYVPTQSVVYTPRTTYQWQARVRGRWNPFRRTYMAYEYTPVTTWSATTVTQSVPVNSQQLVARQQTVYVSQPVQRNETRQQVVLKEVPSQGQQPDVVIASAAQRPQFASPARLAAGQPILGTVPLLARQRVLPPIGNGALVARVSQAITPTNGLRPVAQSASNLQTASYAAPLRTASRTPHSVRDPLQSGLNATVLR